MGKIYNQQLKAEIHVQQVPFTGRDNIPNNCSVTDAYA
jgi:hypothetical protein